MEFRQNNYDSNLQIRAFNQHFANIFSEDKNDIPSLETVRIAHLQFMTEERVYSNCLKILIPTKPQSLTKFHSGSWRYS